MFLFYFNYMINKHKDKFKINIEFLKLNVKG
jgi:hypothetical protein